MNWQGRAEKRLGVVVAVLIFLATTGPLLASDEALFKTKYAIIHYQESRDLSDFLWRLGGHTH